MYNYVSSIYVKTCNFMIHLATKSLRIILDVSILVCPINLDKCYIKHTPDTIL